MIGEPGLIIGGAKRIQETRERRAAERVFERIKELWKEWQLTGGRERLLSHVDSVDVFPES